MPVRVQKEKPLVEGLGLDGAHAGLLFDACGFGFSGVVLVPGPGLPVCVQGEDPTGGGCGEDGLRLPRQLGCGLLDGLLVRILAASLAVLEGVDPALPVHGQEPVIIHADAGEPAALAGVEDHGCRLLAVPGVDVLV